MGSVIASDDQDSGSSLVKAMDNSGAQLAAYTRQLSEMMQKRIHQRARSCTCSCVDDHARGLVHHDHVVILIEDFEWQGFGNSCKRRACQNLDGDHFTHNNSVRALCNSTVDADQPLVDQFLYAGAAEFGLLMDKINVKALSGFSWSHGELARGGHDGQEVPSQFEEERRGKTKSKASKRAPTVMAESATLKAGQW